MDLTTHHAFSYCISKWFIAVGTPLIEASVELEFRKLQFSGSEKLNLTASRMLLLQVNSIIPSFLHINNI